MTNSPTAPVIALPAVVERVHIRAQRRALHLARMDRQNARPAHKRCAHIGPAAQ